MSDQSKREREERALDALIVSQLRRDRDPDNIQDLPELTDEERAAMNALGASLANRLWSAAESEEDAVDQWSNAHETAIVDDEAFAAMNRAEEIDEQTKANIEKRRKEVLERLRRKKTAEDQTSA
jgi:hypothetical protein